MDNQPADITQPPSEPVTRSGFDELLYMGYDAITVSQDAVYAYLKERFNVEVKEHQDVHKVPVDTLDLAVDDFVRAARVDSAVKGAFLGGGGLMTIPFDILSLISASVCLSQKVALAYGFGVRTEAEKAAIWVVLAHASGLTGVSEGPSRLLMETMPSLVQKSPYSRVVIYKLMREVLEQLSLKLGRKGLGAVFPLVGSAVGAASNYKFLGSVGQSSKEYFRARHFQVRKSLEEATAQAADESAPEEPGIEDEV